jgi:hypothetical protein
MQNTQMICNPDEIVIQGITNDGKEFRPRDWAERQSGILSTFGYDQKLAYASYVRPMVLNGIRCVAVSRQLELIDTLTFNYILTFARDNDLRVAECNILLREYLNEEDHPALGNR